MSGKTDVVKGRIKEAAGALTGNDRLRAEGEDDQAVGKNQAGCPEGRRQSQESCRQSDRAINYLL